MFKLSKYLEIQPLPNDESKSLFYSTGSTFSLVG